ncbi:MAG: GGDEF domain-containing protein [Burkholderiaceae bacterium]|nr:MAG: GGDEF domain-containing protein [Burkholderiaceae bacterium]
MSSLSRRLRFDPVAALAEESRPRGWQMWLAQWGCGRLAWVLAIGLGAGQGLAVALLLWMLGVERRIALELGLLAAMVGAVFVQALTFVLLARLRGLVDERTQWHHRAFTDHLTGALGRAPFFSLAEREWSRATREHDRHRFVVLLIDADHFKRVNDRHGHLMGDEVLRSIAECCMGQLRPGDLLARYGGEEFIAVLPRTPIDTAWQLAEQIRRAVGCQHQLPGQQHRPPVSVSVGLTTGDPSQGCLTELIEAADHALYRAKRLGRNRCVIAKDGSGDDRHQPSLFGDWENSGAA